MVPKWESSDRYGLRFSDRGQRLSEPKRGVLRSEFARVRLFVLHSELRADTVSPTVNSLVAAMTACAAVAWLRNRNLRTVVWGGRGGPDQTVVIDGLDTSGDTRSIRLAGRASLQFSADAEGRPT